jgi:hypothetical protein
VGEYSIRRYSDVFKQGNRVPQTVRERIELLERMTTTLTNALREHGDEVDFMAADVIRMGLHVLLETDLKEV